MPCNMYEGADFAASDAREAQRRADEAMAAANKVTDLLCKVLQALPAQVVSNMDPEVRAWFEQHKAHDAAHGR